MTPSHPETGLLVPVYDLGLIPINEIADLDDRQRRFLLSLRRLDNRFLWTLLLAGGRCRALDVLLTAFPVELLAENECVPDEVREAVLAGDRAVQRRLVLAVLLLCKRWKTHAASTPMGVIMTHAIMGRLEKQVPTLVADLAELMPHDEALVLERAMLPGTAMYLLAGPRAAEVRVEEPAEDTRRYFAFLDPWHVRFGRLLLWLIGWAR